MADKQIPVIFETDMNKSNMYYDGGLAVRITSLEGPEITAENEFQFRNWAYNEKAPMVFDGENGRYAIITCHRTCIHRLNEGKTIMDKGAYVSEGSYQIGRPDCVRPGDGWQIYPEDIKEDNYWSHSYFGAFDAFVKDGTFYSVVHGENKNERMHLDGRDLRYSNSVQPDFEYDASEYSGANDQGCYTDAWPHYFGFIFFTYAKESELFADDSLMKNVLGPITWPQDGYIDKDGKSISCGLRHPSMYRDGDYIYIYYLEQSKSSTGFKVIRSKMDENGLPGPFYKLYNGSFSEPALPKDFNMHDKSFLGKPSSKSDNVLGMSTGGCNRFFVAKLKGTEYYIGVQEYMHSGDYSLHNIVLRVSKDLIHWSKYTEIPGFRRNSWGEGNLHYLQVADTEFRATHEVDPKGFIIMGVDEHNHEGGKALTQMIKVSVEVDELENKI